MDLLDMDMLDMDLTKPPPAMARDKYGVPELSAEVKARFHGNVGWFLFVFRIVLGCLVFMRFHKLGRMMNARRVVRAAEAAKAASGQGSGKGGGEAAGEKKAGKGDGAAAEAPGGGSAQRRKARAKAA
jgi:hypothetical protein